MGGLLQAPRDVDILTGPIERSAARPERELPRRVPKPRSSFMELIKPKSATVRARAPTRVRRVDADGAGGPVAWRWTGCAELCVLCVLCGEKYSFNQFKGGQLSSEEKRQSGSGGPVQVGIVM